MQVKRLLFVLAVLSILLTVPNAQSQECIPEKKLALFPRVFIGKNICVHIKFVRVEPLDSYDVISVGRKYLTEFAVMKGRGTTINFYHYLLVPVIFYEKIEQFDEGDLITVYGRVIRISEINYKPHPIIEVSRIDHGGERLQLDLKLKGKK